MKRSTLKVIITALCYALMLGQPLTCSAVSPEIGKSLTRTAKMRPQPKAKPPVPSPAPKLPAPTKMPKQSAESERRPFLERWHSSIPDNSTPQQYGLPGEDWNAYALAEALGSPFEIDLIFGNYKSSVTVDTEMDWVIRSVIEDEKRIILGDEIPLTDRLNELILVSANGRNFPQTKPNPHKQFIGTIYARPYDGVVHTLVICEQYTVQPGDTLSQIILDCGWLPEGWNLYGEDGYLERYATSHRLDLERPLVPGEILQWSSENIRIVDNLYPDIQLDAIPGSLFSHAAPAEYNEGSPDVLNSLPIISDIIEFRRP